MNRIRTLIIEDVEGHALLLVRELQKGGIEPTFRRVETADDLENALTTETWDVIFSDFSLPALDGFQALCMVQAKGLDVPFIVVSGAIGEEKAAEIMKAGAQAFIRKGNYARLVPTLERELREAMVRAERRQTAESLAQHRRNLENQLEDLTVELAKIKEQLQGEISTRRGLEEKLQECERRHAK